MAARSTVDAPTMTPRSFIALFGGSEGTTFFFDVLGRTGDVLIPAREPLEQHHAYMQGVDTALRLQWMRCVFDMPENPLLRPEWLLRLQGIIPGMPIDIDPALLASFAVVGFRMRSHVIGACTPPQTRLRKLLRFPARLPDVNAALEGVLKEKNVALVSFRRNDVLRRAVSSYRMTREKKSQFRRRNREPSTIKPCELKMEMEHYEQYLISQEQCVKHARAAGLKVMEIVYEDFLSNRTGTFRQFFEWMGLPEPSVLADVCRYSRYQKFTSQDLRKVLVNYDEVWRYFEDTPYARFFDEAQKG